MTARKAPSRRRSLGPMARRDAEGDHENKKVPISKPTANAQSPNVQTEITRARLRKSKSRKGSRNPSVIAASPCGGHQRTQPSPHRRPKEGDRSSRGITDLHKSSVGPQSTRLYLCLLLLRQLRPLSSKLHPDLFERAHGHQSHLLARRGLRAVVLRQDGRRWRRRAS